MTGSTGLTNTPRVCRTPAVFHLASRLLSRWPAEVNLLVVHGLGLLTVTMLLAGERGQRTATITKRTLLIPFIIIGCCVACRPAGQATPTPIPAQTASPAPTATALPSPTATPVLEQGMASSAEAETSPGAGAITPDTADKVELLDSLRGHTDRVYGLDFSSDGRLLASGGQDGTIRVWDVASGRDMHIVDGSGDRDVFFAPDDGHVASTHGTIWDIEW
jgi:hypothetical protein